jgi:hypothetical protein
MSADHPVNPFDLESRLLHALKKRLAIVGDRAWYERDAQGHLAALMAASEDLQKLVDALPASTDPRLRHFLERQSYLKAVEWLESRQ